MWILVLLVIMALCAAAYIGRVKLLALLLGQSEARVKRHLRQKP